MQTTKSKTESKCKRRRGSYAEELAQEVRTSVYKAKLCIKVEDKVRKMAPELGLFIKSGTLKFRQALQLLEVLELAPELTPLVVSNPAKCLQDIQQASKEADGELSFEEKVEQSFERWLSKWPKDKRREIWSVIDDTFDAFYE
jgi:hypothetical protein